jgi:hypothetical protein
MPTAQHNSKEQLISQQPTNTASLPTANKSHNNKWETVTANSQLNK